MTWIHTKNKFLKSLVIVLIASQLAFSFTFLLTPKPAEALLGIGDFTFNIKIGDIYTALKDIGLAIAERIALNYANKYLQKFTSQVIDKYRIKDYLAYDKVLSGYYLNQYIYKNVDDPDLRAIYGILATNVNTRATVTDPATGQQTPVLAALQQKLDSYYYNQGGINSSLIYNPRADVSDAQYFAAAQAYFSNPPSFSQQNLYGQFGQMVTDSQKASGQEIAAGNGTKSDRSSPPSSNGANGITGVLPHTCSDWNTGPYQPDQNPRTSEANCTAAGGTWKVDYNGTAMSVIQNPAAFIKSFSDNAIASIFTNNFHMGNNIYTMIGSLLGNFIFNKINVDSNQPGSVLNEAGDPYVPDNTSIATITQDDIDGDGIPDVIRDPTGQLDSCIYGGIPIVNPDGSQTSTVGPPCQGSKSALTITPPPPPCTQLGQDEQDFMLALLNGGTLPQDVADQTNQHFNLTTGNAAVYYPNNNTIGLPEFYIAGHTDTDSGSPPSGQWNVVSRCTGTPPDNNPTCQTSPDWTACTVPDSTDLVEAIRDFQIAQGREVTGECGGFEIVKRVAWMLRADGAGTMATFHSSKCPASGMSGDLVAFPDGSSVDIFSLNAPPAPLTVTWLRNPGPPSTESGVYYVPATDPGDPAGSY